MKKVALLMMVAWLPAILAAQDSPFSAVLERYSGNPGFESSVILPNTTNFVWEKELDNSSLKEMMQGIDKISMLKYKAEGNRDVSEKLWKNIQKAASDEIYTELMNVNAEDVQVRICMIKGNEGNTKEVALAVNDRDQIILITMNGTMDFSSMFSQENLKRLSEMGAYFMEHKGECGSH